MIDGNWVFKGDVLDLDPENEDVMKHTYDISIEDERLQGARLEITYTILNRTSTEKNFDDSSVAARANITGLVDFVDNNLSYNENLGENKRYWDVISEQDLNTEMSKLKDTIYKDIAGINPKSVVIGEESGKYNTILKLKKDSNFFDVAAGAGTVTITLEKVLSSTNSTVEELLTEVIDNSVYSNTVEITGFGYATEGDGYKGIDRIRNANREIILPGFSGSTAASEVLVIHPPTGSDFNMLYLVVAVISLTILAGGVFGIKKFVIKK